MRFESDAFCLLHIEYEQGQSALFGDPRVDLAERSRGAVARIGKGLLAFFFSLLVDFSESLTGHIDLAPYLDIRNRLRHGPDDVLDHLGVHRDILALGNTVASGNCELKLSVLVSKGH